jgi:hypothetical protein
VSTYEYVCRLGGVVLSVIHLLWLWRFPFAVVEMSTSTTAMDCLLHRVETVEDSLVHKDPNWFAVCIAACCLKTSSLDSILFQPIGGLTLPAHVRTVANDGDTDDDTKSETGPGHSDPTLLKTFAQNCDQLRRAGFATLMCRDRAKRLWESLSGPCGRSGRP